MIFSHNKSDRTNYIFSCERTKTKFNNILYTRVIVQNDKQAAACDGCLFSCQKTRESQGFNHRIRTRKPLYFIVRKEIENGGKTYEWSLPFPGRAVSRCGYFLLFRQGGQLHCRMEDDAGRRKKEDPRPVPMPECGDDDCRERRDLSVQRHI